MPGPSLPPRSAPRSQSRRGLQPATWPRPVAPAAACWTCCKHHGVACACRVARVTPSGGQRWVVIAACCVLGTQTGRSRRLGEQAWWYVCMAWNRRLPPPRGRSPRSTRVRWGRRRRCYGEAHHNTRFPFLSRCVSSPSLRPQWQSDSVCDTTASTARVPVCRHAAVGRNAHPTRAMRTTFAPRCCARPCARPVRPVAVARPSSSNASASRRPAPPRPLAPPPARYAHIPRAAPPGAGDEGDAPPSFFDGLVRPLRDFGFGRASFWEGGVGLFVLAGVGECETGGGWSGAQPLGTQSR